MAVIVLVAVVALLLTGSGLDYELQRIWAFQRKRFGRRAEESRTRLLTRLGRAPAYRVDLTEIRDFIVSLQLGTSMDQTLSGSLMAAAEQFKKRGIFGERLMRHVESRLSIAPEEVIKALAEDFKSDHLQILPERLESARNGGISYDQALSITVSQVEDQIRGEVRHEIQQAPIRLTFPMIGGVFLAALILAIFPLLMSLITSV
jgi:hypothetical protein